MTKEKSIVEKAMSYIGIKEYPSGSNDVRFNTDYYGRSVQGSQYPWCCTFVWDIFRECNLSKLFYDGKKTAYCPEVYNWAKKNDLIVNKNNGRTGDLILFDWNHDGLADHIGIIIKGNNDGTYNTVEGNTSINNNSNGGQVMARVRSLSSVLAIVRPKYGSTKKTKKKLPVAMPTLRIGNTGTQVRYLQNDLNSVLHISLKPDGCFGTLTRKAVIEFQRDCKIGADGIYGKNTYAKMKEKI